MHRIGFLLMDRFQLLSLTPQTVFECANFVMGEAFYAVDCFSVEGGGVCSSLGLPVGTRPVSGRHSGRQSGRHRVDTWIVAGVVDPRNLRPSEALLKFVRRVSKSAHRVAATCTGAFVLAEAGLLEGRRATTHWSFSRDLQARFPGIKVEDDRIYIVDGRFWTSAGMTAAMDLALAMVETDLGAEVARLVAHKLVMDYRRTGGQSQHSEMLGLSPKSDRIQKALNYARTKLSRSLSVDDLAEAANLSPRHFSRIFVAETGQSPAKAIQNLRLEAARLMIEQSRHPMETIARETGFRDRRHMREAFIRGFGIPPQSLRRDLRADRKASSPGELVR
jgi:transcriptional regulator GlxA family with amidase domain